MLVSRVHSFEDAALLAKRQQRLCAFLESKTQYLHTFLLQSLSKIMLICRPLGRIALERASTSSSCSVLYAQKRHNSGLPTFVMPFFSYASDCYITQGIQTSMEGWILCSLIINHKILTFLVIHSTGLPWGFTFIASGIALRLATAPAHIYAEKLFAKRMHATNFIHQTILKVIFPLFNNCYPSSLQRVGDHYRLKVVPNEEGTKLTLSTNDPQIIAKADNITHEHTAKYIMENRLQATRIQNLKMFTVPIWVFSSFAIRNIVGGDFSPAVAGALWVPDLLSPDPYLVLPALVGIFGFINLFVS